MLWIKSKLYFDQVIAVTLPDHPLMAAHASLCIIQGEESLNKVSNLPN